MMWFDIKNIDGPVQARINTFLNIQKVRPAMWANL